MQLSSSWNSSLESKRKKRHRKKEDIPRERVGDRGRAETEMSELEWLKSIQ